MKRMNTYLGACGLALVFSCTMDDGRTAVDANELGVASIEVSKQSEGRERLLEVRGFDNDGDELARVRWKVGQIDDLTRWLPAVEEDTSFGSEITFSVGGSDTRTLTRETNELVLTLPDDPNAAKFVSLAPVSSALAAAHMRFDVNVETAEPAADAAYSAGTCNAGYLLTTPLAKQCCYGTSGPTGSIYFTNFIHPDTNAYVKRRRNPYGTGCKASDGVSACSGTGCYYGPNGFAKPAATPPPAGYPYWYIAKEYDELRNVYWCQAYSYSTNVGQYFANVTGTQATNQGCPGGGSSAGYWDY